MKNANNRSRADALRRVVAFACLAVACLALASGCATTKNNSGPQTVDDVLSAERPSW